MRIPPDDVVEAAQAAQKTYGVPASVSLAQWADESAWGARCTGKFNFFGVKAATGQPGTLCWTHEVVGGKSIPEQQLFADYLDMASAFAAHAALLTHPQFARAWPIKTVAGFVQAISLPNKPPYATDPNYATNLMAIITGDRFERYDVAPAT